MTTPSWQLTRPLRLTQVMVDIAILTVAYLLAFLLRYEDALLGPQVELFLCSLPLVLLVEYLCLMAYRVPDQCWRFVSLADGRRICTALVIANVVLILLTLLGGGLQEQFPNLALLMPPRRVLALNLLLGLVTFIGLRVGVRLWIERSKRRDREARRTTDVPTLLIGAGCAGAEVARQIEAHPQFGIKPVGFLDDDPGKTGLVIHGIRVLGTMADLSFVVQSMGAKQVLITIGNPEGESVRRIVDLCKDCSIAAKVIPGIRYALEGRLNLGAIREVAIEDLLRRDPVELDTAALGAALGSRRILITGAGGSIGSELCRIVCRFAPAAVALVENTENNLFHIHRELLEDPNGVDIIPCLADICDATRMEQVFTAFKPDVVLHAAAYKHVPMIEWNPGEAIKNNVIGTRAIANLADRHGVGQFVMISTDKAVNPTSMMGVSKRIAEIYVQAMSQRSRTRFVTVRFGNVLGSAGSVIPTFKAQIARGGPVTVTDPEMRRYFMTIPEASQLVLQAAALGHGGEIFILDMGEPVKIVDLARDLIRLYGFSPEEIGIEFTGLRPGEKLFEEIALQDEVAEKTKHPKIFIGKLKPCNWKEINRDIEELQSLVERCRADLILAKIRSIVPEYEGKGLTALAKYFQERVDAAHKLAEPKTNGHTNGATNGSHDIAVNGKNGVKVHTNGITPAIPSPAESAKPPLTI